MRISAEQRLLAQETCARIAHARACGDFYYDLPDELDVAGFSPPDRVAYLLAHCAVMASLLPVDGAFGPSRAVQFAEMWADAAAAIACGFSDIEKP